VIATTTHAMYYALHPWLANVAERRGLSRDELYRLVRRVEVALAWSSMHHEVHVTQLPEAHGEYEIGKHVHDGVLDLARASEVGNYTRSLSGFAGSAYFGSEVELGLMDHSWRSGSRFTPEALDAAEMQFSHLLALADRDRLEKGDGDTAAGQGLCVCSARSGPLGPWLRELFAGEAGGSRWTKPDADRRGTASLIARSIDQGFGTDPIQAMRRALCFSGSNEDLDVARGLVDQAEGWRGLFLRHYLVSAWRDLWADVVEQCQGMTTGEVQESIASQFDLGTVSDFVASFVTSDGNGLVPAEDAARQELSGSVASVAVMAIAARRLNELGPRAREIFDGFAESEWGPSWLAAEFREGSHYELSSWVRNLVERMLQRSMGIALDKFRLVDGKGVVPAQVRERDGTWQAWTQAGRGPLNLRIEQLSSVCAGAGLFDRAGDEWSITEVGRELLCQ
jgi:hypothetical protein